MKYLKKAAHIGHAESMFRYAQAREAGSGVKQNLRSAMKYTERAAEAGHVEAMFRYALALRNGTGVTRNADRAMRFMQQAAAANHARAIAFLKVWNRVPRYIWFIVPISVVLIWTFIQFH
jgi:TPR repeat protein